MFLQVSTIYGIFLPVVVAHCVVACCVVAWVACCCCTLRYCTLCHCLLCYCMCCCFCMICCCTMCCCNLLLCCCMICYNIGLFQFVIVLLHVVIVWRMLLHVVLLQVGRALCRIKWLPVTHVLGDTWMLTASLQTFKCVWWPEMDYKHTCDTIFTHFQGITNNIYGFGSLFLLLHFLPVHPYFYPSIFVFTRLDGSLHKAMQVGQPLQC